MKMTATVLVASALMAGVSSFAADRTNATEGNKSQAPTTMHNQTPAMPAHANDASMQNSGDGMQRNNATVGNKSEAKKTMQGQTPAMPTHTTDGSMKNSADGMQRNNATVGNKSEAKP